MEVASLFETVVLLNAAFVKQEVPLFTPCLKT
jgi:hypothetical protein